MTETPNHQPANLSWFKSSYSEGSGNICVEVAFTPRTVRVRDSKNTTRPGLTVSAKTWSTFITNLG